MSPGRPRQAVGTTRLPDGRAPFEAWLSRLLALWLASFAGLLAFLYALLIGADVGGRSMFEAVFR